jgi:lysophospholipase L1-like esterase
MPARTILCYGDSNTHGTGPLPDELADIRFGYDERWPGVMRALLGSDWRVIEEGLPGRTTVHDDPVEGVEKNGLTYLKPCLGSHKPIDVLAIMLGTNDLKARFGLPASDIARGVERLCETALSCAAGPNAGAPKLVVIAPVPVEEVGWLAEMFSGGAAKSRRLAPLYKAVAGRFGAAFLDAGSVACCSAVDGIHFDEKQHRLLGQAMAELVKGL